MKKIIRRLCSFDLERIDSYWESYTAIKRWAKSNKMKVIEKCLVVMGKNGEVYIYK